MVREIRGVTKERSLRRHTGKVGLILATTSLVAFAVLVWPGPSIRVAIRQEAEVRRQGRWMVRSHRLLYSFFVEYSRYKDKFGHPPASLQAWADSTLISSDTGFYVTSDPVPDLRADAAEDWVQMDGVWVHTQAGLDKKGVLSEVVAIVPAPIGLEGTIYVRSDGTICGTDEWWSSIESEAVLSLFVR